MGDLFLSEDARVLLKNKVVWIIGDSVQRTIYKDFVTILQENFFSSVIGLKNKGEESYMNDKLLSGGIKGSDGLHNGTHYREHRLYHNHPHELRFFFITRVWDEYWKREILPALTSSQFNQPHVIIVNSCLWDLTRYGYNGGVEDYQRNLKRLMSEMKSTLPKKTLFIWNTTLPLSSDPDKIHGGFLVAEVSIQQKMTLRLDILEANRFAAEEVASNDYDVLDMHFWFRGHQEHRVKDGIHWDNESTRQMTNLLLTRIAESWGVGLPGRLFQIALISAGRDPLLMKELQEAEESMKIATEAVDNDDPNNNKSVRPNLNQNRYGGVHAPPSAGITGSASFTNTTRTGAQSAKRKFAQTGPPNVSASLESQAKKAKKGVTFAV